MGLFKLRLPSLLPVLLVLSLAGCSGVSVSVDYEQSQDFSLFQTYAWLEPDAQARTAKIYNSELFGRRVRQAANRVLQERELTLVESPAGADLLLVYHLGVEQRMDVSTWGGGIGFRDCLHCGGFFGDTQVMVNDYPLSVLAIDLLRAHDRQLIWRGVAERKARTFKDPAEYDRYVAETVNAILARLPPDLGTPPTAEP